MPYKPSSAENERLVRAMREQWKGRVIDYSPGRPARLVQHLDLEDFGGPVLVAGDLDGDGRAEFIIRQQAGAYNDPLCSTYQYDGPRWERIDCTTALTLDGTILWQFGEPWKEDVEYPAHGANCPLVCDIDADGKAEALAFADGTLRILDGATGRESRRVVPEDRNVSTVIPFFPMPREPGCIVLKNGAETDTPGFLYGQGTYLYDHSLRCVFGPEAARYSGHTVTHAPLPPNGECALIDGFCAYDRSGQKLWECTDDDVEEGSHVDSVVAGDINGDGKVELVYCMDGRREFSMVALSGDGHFLWKVVSDHPQTALIANCMTGWDQPQIYMAEKYRGFGAYDGDGNVIWRQEDLDSYPRLIRPEPGQNCLLWSANRVESVAPYVSDGEYRIIWRFDEVLNHEKRMKRIPFRYPEGTDPKPVWFRRDEWGFGYGAFAYDVDGDGCEEVVIYDRYDLWVYKLERSGNDQQADGGPKTDV